MEHIKNEKAIIHHTPDYSCFKYIEGNREVKENKVRELQQSMRMFGFVPGRPIIVNKNMFIIDGQHRWEAGQREKIWVDYIIVDTEDESALLHALNCNQHTWSPNDYIHSWVVTKHPAYVALQKFMVENDLTAHVAFTILAIQTKDAITARIKDGDDFDQNNNAKKIVAFLFEAKTAGLTFYKTNKFATAVTQLFAKATDKQILKLSKKLGIIRQESSLPGYKRVFMDIINKNSNKTFVF